MPGREMLGGRHRNAKHRKIRSYGRRRKVQINKRSDLVEVIDRIGGEF